MSGCTLSLLFVRLHTKYAKLTFYSIKIFKGRLKKEKIMNAQAVLDFWFDQANKACWFAKSDDFDAEIRRRFMGVWQQAARGELSAWRDTLRGRLAEIIVLDQFSRNVWRDRANAFAQDNMALILAQEAVQHAGFADLDQAERNFMLMPFMHSESQAVHKQALPLFERYADAVTLDFERQHKAIIDRFGRYPHRNEMLGRDSTAEEKAFLTQPGSSF